MEGKGIPRSMASTRPPEAMVTAGLSSAFQCCTSDRRGRQAQTDLVMHETFGLGKTLRMLRRAGPAGGPGSRLLISSRRRNAKAYERTVARPGTCPKASLYLSQVAARLPSRNPRKLFPLVSLRLSQTFRTET